MMQGRKREWRPMEDDHELERGHAARGANGEVIEKEMKKLRLAHDYDGETAAPSRNAFVAARGANGEVIEKEMKKLRLAHDYDASRSVWHPTSASDADHPMEIENDVDHNYAARNNMLRECHYLRQLRKFQSERVRERASHLERRSTGIEAQTPYLHEPRY